MGKGVYGNTQPKTRTHSQSLQFHRKQTNQISAFCKRPRQVSPDTRMEGLPRAWGDTHYPHCGAHYRATSVPKTRLSTCRQTWKQESDKLTSHRWAQKAMCWFTHHGMLAFLTLSQALAKEKLKQMFVEGLVHKCSLRISCTSPNRKQCEGLSACEQVNKSKCVPSLLVQCYYVSKGIQGEMPLTQLLKP